ncbi:alcohol dehydrogenase catalytic domain-containing protein [Actinoallomurus oryzae]|uniref:alcohol dehydrogenase catalytic domain-containing protein n=1 Tax=Actinoallomurus oryzae TaxID=502180 RepID=UPI0031E7CC84
MPYPHAAENDVIVRVHAAGFTPGELDWPGTWSDRAGRDRTPSIPGHELSGVVVELGYGTTGLTPSSWERKEAICRPRAGRSAEVRVMWSSASGISSASSCAVESGWVGSPSQAMTNVG